MNRSKIIFALAMMAAAILAAGNAQAQNISVFAGNGQVVCISPCNARPTVFQPLVAIVRDNAGNPMSGVTVNWAIAGNPPSSAALQSQTTVTGADGKTSNQFSDAQIAFATPNITAYMITAATSVSSTNFYEYYGTAGSSPGLPPVEPFAVAFTNLPIGQLLTGPIGSSYDPPLEIAVYDYVSRPLANVSVMLMPEDPNAGPTAQCASTSATGINTSLSDSNGIAHCTVVFGGTPGSARFRVVVAAAYTNGDPTKPQTFWAQSNLLGFTSTPVSIGQLVITGGNNQSANPGQSLASPMQVRVDSSNGTPLAGQQVTWSISPANAGTLTGGNTTATDSNGIASNSLQLASSALGTITVTAKSAADTTKSVSFTETAISPVTITGFSIFAGNNQSAPVGSNFSQPLVVQVSVSGGSAAGIPITFTASGPITISTTSATTDSSGRAQVTAAASGSQGSATVVARVTGASVAALTFNLSVTPPAPVLGTGNFANAADLQPGSFSPCSLAAIVVGPGTFGVQQGPIAPGMPLPNSGISITMNGLNAPVLGVITNLNSQQQVNFQVPCDITPGNAVTSVTAGGASTSVNLNVTAASPGLFLTRLSDSQLHPVLIRPDGSFVSLSNPARRGETITAVVTGLGATAVSVNTGSVAAPGGPSLVTGTVIVGFNTGAVPVVQAERSKDLPGVYLVAFDIPKDAPVSNNVNFSIGLVPAGSNNAYYSTLGKIPVSQ